MKNNFIYIIKGYVTYDNVHDDLGYWLSFGTAKADIKRMMENKILNQYYMVNIEQVKIGRYHEPNIKLSMRKLKDKWATFD